MITHPLIHRLSVALGSTPAHAWVCVAYGGLVAMQFVMPSDAIYSFWFYLCVCLPCLMLAVQQRSKARAWFAHPVARWMAILCAYTLFHALFLTDGQEGASSTVRYTVMTALFVCATAMAFRLPEAMLRRCLILMLYLITIVGIATIAWHIFYHGMIGRLEGFGQNHHAILGANVFAVFALSGGYLFHPNCPSRRIFLPILACATTAVLIALTESRGPMIAFAGGLVMIMLCTRQWWVLAAAGLVVGAIGLDGYHYSVTGTSYLSLSPIYDAVLHLQHRPSHRVEIWKMAWELIQQRPWFGHGMQAAFSYGYGGVNPHNIFISAVFYTGFVGGTLLLGVVVSALRIALCHWRTPRGVLCLVWIIHAILACMTDQGQYVQSPDPLWMIFWLPLSAVVGLLPNMMQRTKIP
jgi:O-antigen ligase